MNPSIEIIVTPSGQTRVETKGFQGTACRAASQFIERALGPQSNEQLTPEFYQTATSQQQVQQGG